MTEDDLIDRERLEAFNAALKLAIAERTGREPRDVHALNFRTYGLDDAQRAFEIFQACWVE